MLIGLIGSVIQAIIFVIFLIIVHFVSSFFFNWARIILYYRAGIDWITNAEKIEFGMVEQNEVPVEVELVDDPLKTPEGFWDDLNETLDLRIKRSENSPDEIFFQGRYKKHK